MAAALGLTGCGNKEKEAFYEAEQNLSKGHYEAALEGFQSAISNEIELAQAYRGEGIALLKLNRYEEAAEAFKTALAQDEGSKKFRKDIWMYKATAEHKNDQAADALISCQEAEALGEDAQCSLLMGKLELELAQYEGAETSFRKAIDRDTSYEMYIDVYQSYVQQDMTADGEEYLKEALEMSAKNEEDYYQRGRVYFFMGDKDSASQELIKAANEGYGEAQLFLGKVYLSNGDPASARAMYQQYMSGDEGLARGYNGLALCDIAEEKYDDALGNIQKGLDIAETDEIQDLLYNEAVAYEKKLDFETARMKMEAYVKLYPEDAEAQKEYEFLQYR